MRFTYFASTMAFTGALLFSCATLAWDQDSRVSRFGEPVRGALLELLSAAAREPGREEDDRQHRDQAH